MTATEFFEYEGERVRVFVPSTGPILPGKEDLKQAYNTVLKNKVSKNMSSMTKVLGTWWKTLGVKP